MIWQFVQQVTKLLDIFFVTKYEKTEKTKSLIT